MRIALLTADVGNAMPNVGDYFITEAVERLLNSHELLRVPMHEPPNSRRLDELKACDVIVLCGTNIVGGNGSIRIAYTREHFAYIDRPVIPLGLGSQASLGARVEIDSTGENLLRYWYESSGPISVRDGLTADLVKRVLGEGAYRLTGCPSITYKTSPFSLTEPASLFCPGPFHYRSEELNRDQFLLLTKQLFEKSGRLTPTLYLAQQPSDFLFEGPKPGLSSFHAPRFPEVHGKIIASAGSLLSFRIHPCIIASTHRVPSFLIALDERTKSLADSIGIPYCAFHGKLTTEEVWRQFQEVLSDYPWEAIEEKLSGLRYRLQSHLEEKNLYSRATVGVPADVSPLRIACIADNRYLPSLVGLLENLSDKHAGPIHSHCLALDGQVAETMKLRFPKVTFSFYRLEDLWEPWELKRVTSRSVAQRAYSSKARLLKRALKDSSEAVLFVDTDMYFYESPAPLLNGLLTGNALLFPHHHDRPKNARLHGKYNTGLMVVARGSEKFLDWWAQLCLYRCDANGPTFYEQGFLDRAPAQFEGIQVYQGKRHNVGPWNLVSLGIKARKESPWLVLDADNRPILSYHAAEHDEEGHFETKFAWDHAVAFFSPIPKRDKHPMIFGNACLQQHRYWPALARSVFFFETIHYRLGISSLRLSSWWVHALTLGPGSRLAEWFACQYGRIRALKRKFDRGELFASRTSHLHREPLG